MAQGRTARLGLDAFTDRFRAVTQGVNQKALDEIMSNTDLVKMKERTPGMLAEYMRLRTRDNIYVPADAIRGLYKAAKRFPEVGDGMFGFVENLNKQLEESVQTGAEIKIPIADYMAYVPNETHVKLSDQLRISENVTAEEAKVVMERLGDHEQLVAEARLNAAKILASEELLKIYCAFNATADTGTGSSSESCRYLTS